MLVRLIELASQQNLGLRAAGVRVLEARARLGQAIGELYPQQQPVFYVAVHPWVETRANARLRRRAAPSRS